MNGRRVIVALAAASLTLVAAASASAQSANNYAGTPPWAFRSDNERIARTNQTNTIEAVRRNGGASAFGGSGGQGGAGWGANSTAVSNYFSVTNNVSCYSAGGAVGSPVTCTGGTNTVSGTNQTTTDSSTSSSVNLTGNTISTTQNGSAAPVGND